jgi:TonB family protein
MAYAYGVGCITRARLRQCLRGEVAERSNAAVLKTVSPQGLGGSNPSLSASSTWSCPGMALTGHTGDIVNTLEASFATKLEVCHDLTGVVDNVTVVEGSGNARIDDTAQRAAYRWKYDPHDDEGKRVRKCIDHPFRVGGFGAAGDGTRPASCAGISALTLRGGSTARAATESPLRRRSRSRSRPRPTKRSQRNTTSRAPTPRRRSESNRDCPTSPSERSSLP